MSSARRETPEFGRTFLPPAAAAGPLQRLSDTTCMRPVACTGVVAVGMHSRYLPLRSSRQRAHAMTPACPAVDAFVHDGIVVRSIHQADPMASAT